MVCTTSCFWNNLHQVFSNPKYLKARQFKSLLEQENPKGKANYFSIALAWNGYQSIPVVMKITPIIFFYNFRIKSELCNCLSLLTQIFMYFKVKSPHIFDFDATRMNCIIKYFQISYHFFLLKYK